MPIGDADSAMVMFSAWTMGADEMLGRCQWSARAVQGIDRPLGTYGAKQDVEVQSPGV